MALDTIQQPELAEIERIGEADLVIGMMDPDHKSNAGAAAGIVHDALGRLSNSLRTVVVCQNGIAGAASAGLQRNDDVPSPAVVWVNLPQPEPSGANLQNSSEAYQAVLAIGGRLGARACGVISSEPDVLTSESVYLLVHPLFDMGFDLVMPRYTRQKMEGLLNRSILAPLSRALYGERLENPLGPDFGISARLLQRILPQSDAKRAGSPVNPVASISSTAACYGFQVCESYLGVRVQPATNWGDLSTLLALVLGSVFTDVERNAAAWQRIRGSKHVPWFGTREPDSGEGGAVDLERMVETFQLGTQNLQEVWGAVLPPTTLLELRRLARLPSEQFRIPDDLWASIVYDFVLGHRLRTISRDHLLRSITPLYLGWIASYGKEMESAGPQQVEARLERLSVAFESRKPYLLSRWRWPDRFNP